VVKAVRPQFLIGFMGAGKSTVGPILAERLGRPFTDLDDVIEGETGRTIAELFDEVGEDGFREAERHALRTVARDPAAIVACGGGIVVDRDSRELLAASGDVIYLTVSADEALARVRDQLERRPLLQGADPAGAAALLGLRERLYEQVADFTVGTVGHTPATVADRIAEWTVLEP
jgi:shikimate kinase